MPTDDSPAPAAPAPAAPTPAPAPAADAGNKFADKGAIVVANGDPGPLNGRGVIVAERRAPAPKLNAKGDKVDPNAPDEGAFYEGMTYGKADAMVRYDSRATPQEDTPVFTVGDTLVTGEMTGLSQKQGEVNVGPASPIYAAVNFAYLRGARDITIVGMTDAEKAHLSPWFDIVHDRFPDVTINY